jgi:hypothetical protein
MGEYDLYAGCFISPDLSSSGTFSEQGGTILLSQMELTGGTFNHAGGTCTISNVLTLENGIWQDGTIGQTFGQLQLDSGTNSTVQFPANTCVLQFSNSSSLTWSNTGVLTIVNWTGSLTGGGTNQLIFGANANALTAQQLSQIHFSNPAGLSAGTYTATILTNGEVVPGTTPLFDDSPAPFFAGEASLGSNWYYLDTSPNNIFGYYNMAYFPYVYHLDMGWEYYIDSGNSNHGAYFYDFSDGAFFYTEPGMFPFIYDFSVNAWMYYLPQSGSTDRYTSNPRWFYNYSTQTWGNHL